MHFKRLHLQGFKSFVDSTDLLIDAGLTGIVGPNGCGKSNLVEALRWVMGETSAKRMRGLDMDDVIFAGTATRPSRNVAEVQLHLDNADRTAAAEFNDADELVIQRQIEREKGSDYRVNGKPRRQRDIQILFADHSTGAHSTSVVGQGQVDALIRAKPQERRQILEEASGTAGLQSRRHEAELKLKGAEQNLTRVDDIMHTQEAQLKSLKQQVRQASRYRNLADHIRRTEATLLHLRWVEAQKNAEATRQAMNVAESRVNELMIAVTQSTTERTELAAAMPDLRKVEAAAASIVQKLILEREQIDAETRRLEQETTSRTNLLTQAKSDLGREQERQSDGAAALQRLGTEQTTLTTRQSEIEASLPSLSSAFDAIASEVATLDAALTVLMQQAADAEARQKTCLSEIASLEQRRASMQQRREQFEAQRASLLNEIAARPDLSLASAMVDACESELAKRQEQAAQAEQARHDADSVLSEKREVVQNSTSSVMRLKAEIEAIQSMLDHDRVEKDTDSEALLDLISVAPGLEKALAVALGDTLSATLDEKATRYWREMSAWSETPALPEGVKSLSEFVKAPPALARSLSQIGLVDDEAAGMSTSQNLKAGQVLVSRDGGAWRWDGFIITPRMKATTAHHLEQRNRLLSLRDDLVKAEAVLQTAQQDLTSAQAAFEECQNLDAQTRSALKAAFSALNDARENYARQERENSTSQSKLQALNDSLAHIGEDMETITTRISEVEVDQKTLPNVEELRMEIASKRATLAEQRGQQAQRQSERDQATRDLGQATQRLKAIESEKQAWRDRSQSAVSQIEELEQRIKVLTAELQELASKPQILTEKRDQILTSLTEAETTHKQTSDAVITAEQKLAMVEAKLKQNENALAEAREGRVRIEAALQAVDEHFAVLRDRMTEKLSCEPEGLRAIAEIEEGAEIPPVDEVEQRLGKFVHEREAMGPVNLRAEVESETLQSEMDKLLKEKEDLVAAIAKLRQGIHQLNKEARERLQVAFTAVDERFQKMFHRLFNGGKAHLELIDGDDPTNAGLEIFAAPPGKKPQVLSLLSGGERTLTALALLFAVFQTNPSPICVLDEAEAALDEGNIGRFCDLVSDMAKETTTRFLIITHHRLTMARMDRLYGVTMSEKGVSKLVSVDLNAAVAMRDKGAAAVDQATDALAAVQAA